MKKILILFAAILLSTFTAFAQIEEPKGNGPAKVTVDWIVDKYINALGGREKLLSLKTVRMTGTSKAGPFELKTTLTMEHLVGSRTDLLFQDGKGYSVETPRYAAAYFPWTGQKKSEPVPGDLLKVIQADLDIQSPLLDYKAKGISVEFLGIESGDDEDNYKLKLTYKSGLVTTYFISSKTYRLTRASNRYTVGGQARVEETTYSNYKQNSDGYWFPYTIQKLSGDTNLDKIETNIPVDPAIFINDH